MPKRTAKSISGPDEIPSFAAYMARVGATSRSLRKAVVVEPGSSGYSRTLATIILNKEGTVDAPEGYEPTDDERARIKAECASVTWPELKPMRHGPALPPELRGVAEESIFEIRDAAGMLLMLHQRVEHNGRKSYLPWTCWSDDRWRRMEPDGRLPLYGMDQLKDHTTVFIHEGAKAARAVREMVEAQTSEAMEKLRAHPWGEQLGSAAHLGWIGGANRPLDTDWAALHGRGITRVYIVSDNDDAGRIAVPKIAKQLRVPTYHVQFTNDWPEAFDLADPFPDRLFVQRDVGRAYVGPTFGDCVHLATWMTDTIPNKRGRPTPVLRDHARALFHYVPATDQFVCEDEPRFRMRPPTLNNALSRFSDTPNISNLLLKNQTRHIERLCYRPDRKERFIITDGATAFNLYTGTSIQPIEGDPKPFLDFMGYLIEDDAERHQMLRWCATLVARPDIRMEYGVLLISEQQGQGKTTLGNAILAPLVGMHNVSFPSEEAITGSQFNSWAARRRLVCVSEIYSGQSRKPYNHLKQYITDRTIDINEKNEKPYTCECWTHVFATSNSRRALSIAQEDRRFFVPAVTECHWGRGNFDKLYAWLKADGLGIILNWAHEYGDYVAPGERAPQTRMKTEVQRNSLHEAAQALLEQCEALIARGACRVISAQDALAHAKGSDFDARWLSAHDLGKAMLMAGMIKHEDRVQRDDRSHTMFLTPKAVEELAIAARPNDWLRERSRASRAM